MHITTERRLAESVYYLCLARNRTTEDEVIRTTTHVFSLLHKDGHEAELVEMSYIWCAVFKRLHAFRRN